MSSVQVLKLSSGEDIISTVKEIDVEGNKIFLLEKPAIVLMSPNPERPYEMTLGIAPFVPYAKEQKVMIMPQHVVALFEPDTTLHNEYNKRFGSGLVLPDSGIKQTLKG